MDGGASGNLRVNMYGVQLGTEYNGVQGTQVDRFTMYPLEGGAYEMQKWVYCVANWGMRAYSGGVFYDIHPIKATTTLTSAFSTTNGSKVVTLTFSSSHNINKFDIILLDNFTSITNSGLYLVILPIKNLW